MSGRMHNPFTAVLHRKRPNTRSCCRGHSQRPDAMDPKISDNALRPVDQQPPRQIHGAIKVRRCKGSLPTKDPRWSTPWPRLFVCESTEVNTGHDAFVTNDRRRVPLVGRARWLNWLSIHQRRQHRHRPRGPNRPRVLGQTSPAGRDSTRPRPSPTAPCGWDCDPQHPSPKSAQKCQVPAVRTCLRLWLPRSEPQTRRRTRILAPPTQDGAAA